MKASVKVYVVSTTFSSRQIMARNKKEAIKLFKQQLKNLVSDNDKITVRR